MLVHQQVPPMRSSLTPDLFGVSREWAPKRPSVRPLVMAGPVFATRPGPLSHGRRFVARGLGKKATAAPLAKLLQITNRSLG